MDSVIRANMITVASSIINAIISAFMIRRIDKAAIMQYLTRDGGCRSSEMSGNGCKCIVLLDHPFNNNSFRESELFGHKDLLFGWTEGTSNMHLCKSNCQFERAVVRKYLQLILHLTLFPQIFADRFIGHSFC